MLQLHPCRCRRELPVNRGLSGIAGGLHCGQLTFQRSFGSDAPLQALASKDAQFDLGHVEPTAMLGGVMELQLLPQAMGFCRRKGLIERSRFVGVEIVQDDPNHLRLRVAFIDQPFQLVGEVLHRALSGHFHVPPARLRLTAEEDIPRAIALVFIIIACHLTGADSICVKGTAKVVK